MKIRRDSNEPAFGETEVVHIACFKASLRDGWSYEMLSCIRALIAATALFFAHATSFANERIGIVMLHGKVGLRASVKGFAQAMARAGALTEVPVMPYPHYSGTLEDAFRRIDESIGKLKQRGAKTIAVGGVSMGANTALAYAAQRKNVAAVFAVAPGHVPDVEGFQKRIGYDYRKARAMVASGRGNVIATFRDSNQGVIRLVRTTARNYDSWFNPDGQAIIPRSAAGLSETTALLWVVGTKDAMYARGRAYAYGRAPPHARNAYLVVSAGHKGTIYKSGVEVCNWLGDLTAAKAGPARLTCGAAFGSYRKVPKKLCSQGDMAACRRACARGKQAACRRLSGTFKKTRCRDGDIEACRRACARGKKKACRRLRRM